MSVGSLISRFRGHEDFHVDFMGRRRLWFMLSGALILISLFAIFVLKLNLGIDFRGGTQLTFPNDAGLTTEDVREALADAGHRDAVVQLTDGGQEVTVRTEFVDQDELAEVRQALAEPAGIDQDAVSVEQVGPRWGEQISVKALQGLIIFLIVISIYISFRFEWKMAVGALAALFHDLLITAGIYALVGREVTPETVIAILTILGYSLYDTVVIFDKIQENTESLALVQRETYSGAVNLSLNGVLMRSVNTSLTSLLPIGALLFLGGETLKDFAFALFVGVGVGTYSSLFVAAPVLAILKEREPKLQAIRDRAARRTGRPDLRVADAEEPEEVPRDAAPARTTDRPPRPSTRPAPRKSRKKRSRAQRKGRR